MLRQTQRTVFSNFLINVQSEPKWQSYIIVYILSAIVIWIFPPPPAQNCDVCFQWHKNRMKCDMAVQTEFALQNIGYLSDLGPHMKVAWAWFEKIGFVLFRLS